MNIKIGDNVNVSLSNCSSHNFKNKTSTYVDPQTIFLCVTEIYNWNRYSTARSPSYVFYGTDANGNKLGPFSITSIVNQDEEHFNYSENRLEKIETFDCSYLDLYGADFSNQDLRFSNFSHANLAFANFSNCNLSGANFEGANISNANFSCADLTVSDLNNARAKGDRTYLDNRSSDFRTCKFDGANLSSCDLSGADLSYAKLHKANLSNSNLTNTDLTKTTFVSANLTKAKLFGANLLNTNFNNANLSETDFTRALIIHTNFDRTNFTESKNLKIRSFRSEDLVNKDLINLFVGGVGNMPLSVNDLTIYCGESY